MPTVDRKRQRAAVFGEQLRQIRKKANRSLRHVERTTGLNSGYLSQLENGKIAHPSPSILQKLASGYGVRFEDLLEWAGYTGGVKVKEMPNQAVALSSVSELGEPSDEELQTLKAIVDLLQSKRSATLATPPSDLPLDAATRTEVRRYVLALLREADAFGRTPTPLEDIQQAAKLVLTDELSLDLRDRERLREQFGKWVGIAWRRLQGTLAFRSSEIWVKPDLHPMKHRFVLAHEIGHAILPAHANTFAYVDDFTRLPPHARDLFEREANQAAVELLFQAGRATEHFDSSPPALAEICRIADSFGGSIVAGARYLAETSRRSVAVAIAHRNDGGGHLGPTHLYPSRAFESKFAWRASESLPQHLRSTLLTGPNGEAGRRVAHDRCGEPHMLTIEKMDTGYAALLLITPRPRRGQLRRLLVPSQSSATAS